MATSPISPSKFHIVIRELAAVRTAGGFAALLEGLLFLSLVFILIFVNQVTHKLVLVILIVLGMLGFGVFAFLRLRQSESGPNDTEVQTDTTARAIVKKKNKDT